MVWVEEAAALKLREALERSERYLYNRHEHGLSDEYAIVLDSEGNQILEKMGTGNRVDIDRANWPRLKDAIFTHSHPMGWHYAKGDPRYIGNSFSPADLVFAVTLDLKEIRAVSRGHLYRMVRPESGWGDVGVLGGKIDRAANVIGETFMGAINKGTMTPEEATSRRWHETWLRLAPLEGWHYERIKYDDHTWD